MDRFGWERDRNSPTHDRLVIDWMDALQDYPLDEIRAACREAVKSQPNRMPNEGHILSKILEARARHLLMTRRPPEPEPERPRANPDAVAAIMGGFVKRFGGDA